MEPRSRGANTAISATASVTSQYMGAILATRFSMKARPVTGRRLVSRDHDEAAYDEEEVHPFGSKQGQVERLERHLQVNKHDEKRRHRPKRLDVVEYGGRGPFRPAGQRGRRGRCHASVSLMKLWRRQRVRVTADARD